MLKNQPMQINVHNANKCAIKNENSKHFILKVKS